MSARILVVEDEALIAMEMTYVISDLGYECVGVAVDVPSAIKLACDKIDIALVDVNLMDGATGPMIGRRLAEEFDIKVVFVTANPEQLGDGVTGTLGAITKPLEIRLLKEVLSFVIAGGEEGNIDPPARLKLF